MDSQNPSDTSGMTVQSGVRVINQPAQDSSVQTSPQPPAVKQPEDSPDVVVKKITEPENPVSGSSRELGPVANTQVKEYVQPSHPELQLPEEVKEAGVASTPNPTQPVVPAAVRPQLTLEKDSVPVQTKPRGIIQLPMEEEKALEVTKTKKPMESIRWLATLIIEQAKRAHKFIKK